MLYKYAVISDSIKKIYMTLAKVVNSLKGTRNITLFTKLNFNFKVSNSDKFPK